MYVQSKKFLKLIYHLVWMSADYTRTCSGRNFSSRGWFNQSESRWVDRGGMW